MISDYYSERISLHLCSEKHTSYMRFVKGKGLRQAEAVTKENDPGIRTLRVVTGAK